MRVGHYVYGLNVPGGVRTYVLELADAQRRRGHEVTLCDHVEQEPAGTPEGWNVTFLRDSEHLSQVVADRRLDVLHTHHNLPVGFLGDAGVPLVRTLHGHSPYCPSGSRFLARRGLPCMRTYSPLGCLWGHVTDHCGSVRPLKFAQEFRERAAEAALLPGVPTLVVSDFLKREMTRAGYPARDIHVLYLPVWERLQAPPAPPPTGDASFLFLGRLVPAKGMWWLLRAFAAVPRPARLEIAGDGFLAAELQREAVRLGLDGRVRFHGWVDARRARQLLEASTALVVPSVWHEPSGTVALEAAAAGRAVVASDVGGLPEYVQDGQTGLVVPAGDVPALAAALQRLMQEPATAARLGSAGRARALEAFDAAGHLATVDRVYEASLRARRDQPADGLGEGRAAIPAARSS